MYGFSDAADTNLFAYSSLEGYIALAFKIAGFYAATWPLVKMPLTCFDMDFEHAIVLGRKESMSMYSMRLDTT